MRYFVMYLIIKILEKNEKKRFYILQTFNIFINAILK